MHKKVAAVALSATLLAGGAVGAIIFVPGAATAASSATSAAAPQWMTDALSKLVGDGTIDQGQADAVSQAIEAAKPDRDGPGGPHGPGGPGMEAVESALGVTADELHTALESGQTIAQVAVAKGVEVQTVIDAIVASATTHIDQAVTSGRITQAEADQKKADLMTQVTDMVNKGRPAGGPGGGRPGGPHRGPGSDGPPADGGSGQGGGTTDTTA